VQVISSGHIELFYTDTGSGTPLILLSGLGADSESWLPVEQQLPDRYRIIRMDNRGIGKTQTAPDQPVTIEAMSRDVAALMQHLHIDRAAIAGHSMGSSIALYLASNRPELVNNLILVNTFITLRPVALHAYRTNADLWEQGFSPVDLFRIIMPWLFSDAFFADSQLVNATLKFVRQSPPAQTAADFKRQLLALENFDAHPLLPGIHTPTLIISGDRDILTPADEAAQMASLIPNAKHATIRAAHGAILEQPQPIARLLHDFIMNSDI
jgi:pimeloyl-ACP methyl ester carboxylesterase